MKDVLEKAELTLKLKDSNTICVEQVNLNNKVETSIKNKDEIKENKIEDKKEEKPPMWKKVLTSSYKVFEEFFDSMARKLLKEKYKLNYSVYNDGKKAFVALKSDDIKTFLKKGTDSILYAIKKIPASTKKIIKNTKNVAIDEVFSWKED